MMKRHDLGYSTIDTKPQDTYNLGMREKSFIHIPHSTYFQVAETYSPHHEIEGHSVM